MAQKSVAFDHCNQQIRDCDTLPCIESSILNFVGPDGAYRVTLRVLKVHSVEMMSSKMETDDDDDEFGTHSVKLNRSTAPLIHMKRRPTITRHHAEKELNCPILLPFGPFKTAWNIFLFFILVYSVIEIPFTLSIIGMQNWQSWSSPAGIIGLFTDLCLSIDIIFNFRVESLTCVCLLLTHMHNILPSDGVH